ncbi:hypothetical protein DSECCO2_451800 [anaerobic digester metagenome]
MHHVVTGLQVFIIHDGLTRGKARGVALAFIAVKDLMIGPEPQLDVLDLKAFVQHPDVTDERCVLGDGLAHATLLRGIVKEQIVLPAGFLLMA